LCLIVDGKTLNDGIVRGQTGVAVASGITLSGETLSSSLATGFCEAGTKGGLGASESGDDGGELHGGLLGKRRSQELEVSGGALFWMLNAVVTLRLKMVTAITSFILQNSPSPPTS
jgi:hypothetical protein